MGIGIATYNLTAPELVQLANRAEAAGYDSLWLGEHLVCPRDYSSVHPTTSADHVAHPSRIVSFDTELLDPLTALSAVAATTTTLNVATGIYLITARHPLLTARAARTLQAVAGGRFILAVGAGWMEEEFLAVGAAFDHRGARLAEAVTVVRRACAGGLFSFDGEYYQVDDVQVAPDPISVPIIMGGNAPPALRRAAAIGDGWFVSGRVQVGELCRLRDDIERHRLAAGRSNLPFTYYVRVEDLDDVPALRAEGFDNLLLWIDDVWSRDQHVSDPWARLHVVADRLGLTSAER